MKIPEHLLPTQFHPFTRLITHRVIMVKPGTTPEMVLDPDFWVHGSLQTEGYASGSILKVWDRIEVLAEDGSFDLELRCVAIDARGYWAQMRLLNWWPKSLRVKNEWLELPDKTSVQQRADPDGYVVEHAGAHKWRIVDRAKQIVDRGYPSEADAWAALAAIKAEKTAA